MFKRLQLVPAIGAVAAVMAIAALSAPSSALAYTYNTFDGGTGRCFLYPNSREITAPAVTYTNGTNAALTVEEWVVLVDLNGNPVSQWLLNARRSVAAHSQLTFGEFTVNQNFGSTYSYARIKRHIMVSNSSGLLEVWESTTTSYKTYFSGQYNGIAGYC